MLDTITIKLTCETLGFGRYLGRLTLEVGIEARTHLGGVGLVAEVKNLNHYPTRSFPIMVSSYLSNDQLINFFFLS